MVKCGLNILVFKKEGRVTAAQKRLRELRERQSKERGRMAELGLVDELKDEQRAELDTIEKGTPDLERQIRGATVAVDTESEAAENADGRQPRCRATRAD